MYPAQAVVIQRDAELKAAKEVALRVPPMLSKGRFFSSRVG